MRFAVIVLLGLASGCYGTYQVSKEDPLHGFVGECYQLQKNMDVYENVCWSLGDLLLSPTNHSSCLKEAITSVKSNTQFIVKEVLHRDFGTYGTCPIIEIKLEGFESDKKKLYIPVCGIRPTISWSEERFWSVGDAIRLRTDYATPCDTPLG